MEDRGAWRMKGLLFLLFPKGLSSQDEHKLDGITQKYYMDIFYGFELTYQMAFVSLA